MELQVSTIGEIRDEVGEGVGAGTGAVGETGEPEMEGDMEMGAYEPENPVAKEIADIRESNPLRTQLLGCSIGFWFTLALFLSLMDTFFKWIIMPWMVVAYVFYIGVAKSDSMRDHLSFAISFSGIVENFRQMKKIQPVVSLKCECFHLVEIHGDNVRRTLRKVTYSECHPIPITWWADESKDFPNIANEKHLIVDFEKEFAPFDEESMRKLKEMKKEMDDRNQDKDVRYISVVDYDLQENNISWKYLVTLEGVHSLFLNITCYILAFFSSLLWFYGLYFNSQTDELKHVVRKVWKIEQASLY